jgi:hypothetical protein
MPYSDAINGSMESGFETLQDKLPIHISQRINTISAAVDNLSKLEALYNQSLVQSFEPIVEAVKGVVSQEPYNQDINSIRQNVYSIYEGA